MGEGAVQGDDVLEVGQFGVAISYLLCSVLGGLGAAWLGMSLARL